MPIFSKTISQQVEEALLELENDGIESSRKTTTLTTSFPEFLIKLDICVSLKLSTNLLSILTKKKMMVLKV